MPSTLHLKREDLENIEKRTRFTISVIGCRYEGVILALAFAESGFRVICSDIDRALVEDLNKGKAPLKERETKSKLKGFLRKGELRVTNEISDAVTKSDVVIITNTTRINSKNTPDHSKIRNTCKKIGQALHRGVLVICSDIAGVGSTEGLVKETLENNSRLQAGRDFGLAYAPIKLDQKTAETLSKQEIMVAAIDKKSLNLALKILETITGIEQIGTLNIRLLELATIFWGVKKELNLALANELAVYCEETGQDYFDLIDFTKKNQSDFALPPKIDVAENRKEVYLLLESAENLNAKFPLTLLARKINESMVRYAIKKTRIALKTCGKTLRRARIAILSASKPSICRSFSKATIGKFVKVLETKGTKINLYDLHLLKYGPLEIKHLIKKSLDETIEKCDCIVILTNGKKFRRLNLKKMRAIMKMPAAIVDFGSNIEPQKAEKEGFVYRRLGRGAPAK